MTQLRRPYTVFSKVSETTRARRSVTDYVTLLALRCYLCINKKYNAARGRARTRLYTISIIHSDNCNR